MAQNFLDLTAASSQGDFNNQNLNAKTSGGDTIAGNSSTTETLTVGGSNTGYINSGTDVDWFAVDLVAGQRYVFTTSANGASPVGDTVLRLLDSNSTQLAINDDANGLYSEISFTATTSGTYYLEVDGYGTSYTGGYALSAAIAPPATSVLPTLDWGGVNNVATTNAVINVYFANNGETFDGETSVGWGAAEEDAAMAAFDQFSDYINVTFNVVNTAAASDFQMVQVASLGGGTLGYFNPPGTTNAGVGVFAQDGQGWDAAGLAQGGYGFITLIHEIGHGLGLAHPHDMGGNSTVMNGVTSAQGDYGTYNLNQGIFTMMSYNDGWPAGPNGVSPNNGYGWAGTAMALDIAALQIKYGVNTTNQSGNSSYALSANNAAGTFYSSIWDTGGTDTISFSGSANATIDLREASLLEETNGGGYVSFVAGVHGGYTIANGVVIENATGGSGDDTLTGNEFANAIVGNDGNDIIGGNGGADYLQGRNGNDLINGGAGDDILLGQNDNDTLSGGIGEDQVFGQAGNDILYGDAGNDIVSGGLGNDTVSGGAGADVVLGGGGDDILNGGDDDDILSGGGGIDTLNGDAGNDTIVGAAGNDTLNGGAGADILSGGTGNDTVSGGLDNDQVFGAANDDILNGNEGNDTVSGGTGVDNVSGGAGNDTVLGGLGNDSLFGNEGVDILSGGSDDDYLYGGTGNDTVLGGSGIDVLYGDGGDDFLFAGTGNDMLIGGAGNDYMNGQAGDDLFVFADGFGNDTIAGFSASDALEKINLSGVTEIVDFNDLINNHLTQVGNNAVITDGVNTITLVGIDELDLIAADFAF